MMYHSKAFEETIREYNRMLMETQSKAMAAAEENSPVCSAPEAVPEAAPVQPANTPANTPINTPNTPAAAPERVQAQPSCARDRADYHSQTVGPNGPVLLQDSLLHETLETFVSSVPRERVVHTKGYGAMGHFQAYQSMSAYTTAGFLQDPGRVTPTFTRFSLAVSNRGTPDTARNVRGFATKFYTKEGVFDIVGNQIPVFFIRDAIRFPEVIAALKPSPVNNLADPARLWEFVARTPETTHMLTWLYSEVGTVASFRRMRGYGINTFVWRNAADKRHYIKYHWLPLAGEKYLTAEEAERIACQNPDALGQELYEALAAGNKVEYELCVQIMDPADADTLAFDPLDDTKTWSETQYPLQKVGKLTLEKNPDAYWTQVERAAFSPSNLVEGIELSADKMLQGRSFIYWDAQRSRLGPDFRSYEVNKPPKGAPDSLVTSGAGVHLHGEAVRMRIEKPDDFAQAGERYLSMTQVQRDALAQNIAGDLSAAPLEIQNCVIGYLSLASNELGEAVRRAIGQGTSPGK